jgi:hypothetical protein
MEQRRSIGLDLDQTVNVTILGDITIRRIAKVKNTSGHGLGLEMADPVGIGSPMKIELGDTVLLGEATSCHGENGAYYVGIELFAVTSMASRRPRGLFRSGFGQVDVAGAFSTHSCYRGSWPA